jgi:hypothetical protein
MSRAHSKRATRIETEVFEMRKRCFCFVAQKVNILSDIYTELITAPRKDPQP